MHFATPWISVIGALMIAAAWYWRRRARPPAIVFSQKVPLKGRRSQWLHAPAGLRAAAVACLLLALARPQSGDQHVRDVTRGIGIQLVLDRSLSMGAEFGGQGAQNSRLEVAKRVAEEFIQGRPSDAIGLVTFAGEALTACPLTLSHKNLIEALRRVKLAGIGERGTAIGDAVSLAAARLQDAQSVRGKAIVLLTDGRSNAGARSVDYATSVAAKWAIRVYVVSITDGNDERDAQTLLDEAALANLTKTSGGISLTAGDPQGLRSVYGQIDRIEKADLSVVRMVNPRELYGGFVGFSLLLLLCEVTLVSTWLRRSP